MYETYCHVMIILPREGAGIVDGAEMTPTYSLSLQFICELARTNTPFGIHTDRLTKTLFEISTPHIVQSESLT